jgi:hypothetical protein
MYKEIQINKEERIELARNRRMKITKKKNPSMSWTRILDDENRE